MKVWLDTLDPDDRQTARTLLVRGCEFIWRDEASQHPVPEPDTGQWGWLEIWCGSDLLSFLGPVQWPLPKETAGNTGVFMIRQVESMMRSRRA